MDFKYCPNCKAEITFSDRLIDCKNCGFHFYINPALTNGIILENEKGEILLVKRKFEPKKDFWDVAGGFVEFTETLEESMRRETKEELDIDLENLTYFTSTPDRYLYKDYNYHTLCVFFTAKTRNQNFKISDDISNFRFFKKDEIPFAKIAFAGVKTALKKYLSSFQ